MGRSCVSVYDWVLHSVESETRKRLFSVYILFLVEDIRKTIVLCTNTWSVTVPRRKEIGCPSSVIVKCYRWHQ